MSNSFNTGLLRVIDGARNSGQAIPSPTQTTFTGYVLDVCLDDTSPLYTSERDIGVIRFKNLSSENLVEEDIVANFAYPIDRSITRYPYPGEQVIVTIAYGEPFLRPDKNPKEIPVTRTYFYSTAISLFHNPTYNSHPEIAVYPRSTPTSISDLLNPPDPRVFETRFERQILDLDAVKTSTGDIKVYPQLRPYEGDMILQGRFGNSIRFGSTSAKVSQPWADGSKLPGSSGDGIMVLRVDNLNSTKVELVEEDVDTDATSIYLTTTQKVNVALAGSKELKSWKATYRISDLAAAQDRSVLYDAGKKAVETEQYVPNPNIPQEITEPGIVTGNVVIEVPQLGPINYSMNDLSFSTAITGEKKDLTELLGVKGGKNEYVGGSQLVLNSERVIVNARDNYLMLFGQEGVAVSSQGNVNIDADDSVTIFGEDGLYLGVPGKGVKKEDGSPVEGNTKMPKNKAQATLDSSYEPLVLGTKLINIIDDLLKILQTATVVTGIGNGAFREDVQYELESLQARLPEMLSTYAYIDGISHNPVLKPEPDAPTELTQPTTTLTGTVTIALPTTETTTQQAGSITNPYVKKPKYPSQPTPKT